ncbi:hypothetical protein OROHE_021940 [Orobanche hederae]
MLSSVSLEVMNSTNPELSWNTVTKGRRSRKSVAARSLNGIAKVSNSTSPKRVGDFSGSDSDKAGKVVLEHSTSGKSESVPIKKRRHLLQSGSPHPWTRSLRRQGSRSPQTCASPSFEDQDQLLYSSGQQSSNRQLHKLDRSAKFRSGEALHNLFPDEQTTLEYNDAGDFSGIELLAAAASMDIPDDGSANKQDLVVKDSFIPKESDASGSATPYKTGPKSNELGNSSSPMVLLGVNTNIPPVLINSAAAASQRLSGSPEDDEIMPKVSRQHWDLNTLMDAWGVPYSDSIAANTSKDVYNDMHIEERQKACGNLCPNPGGTKDEYFDVKIEENKLTAVSPNTHCSVQLEKPLGEPPSNNPYSRVSGENSLQANTTVDSNFDAHMDTNQVVITDSILDNSPFTKPSCSFGLLMSAEKMNSMPGPVLEIPDEDCSSNMREFDITTVSGRIVTRTQDFRALVMPDSEIPQSLINFQGKHTKDIQKTTEQHGTIVHDGQLVLTSDSEAQNDGNFASVSTIKHDDNNTPNESTRNMTEDSSKSCSPPTVSVGKIGSTIDGRPNSDVSRNNRLKMVDGDELTGFQEGYDSPFEDGELRGSFLYSWEYNEVENECLDYESDGRNGDDGSDAAGYPGSVIVEVGSEGSHGTVRSSLLVDGFPQGKSKGELAKSSAIGNNEMAGKGSNAGSGTTVDHSLEMFINEDGEGMMKGDYLTNRREAVGVKLTRIDEYELKTAGGKIQNRIEGRSRMDATDSKDGFFIQQCRSRRPSSYSRSEMDISPEKYTFRYRAASHGERDGVHQFTTSWGSRRRYTSGYQGSEGRPQTRPRSKHGDFGLDFHDPRQNADYLPNGFHRPFMRRSPIERDDFLGPSRRMPANRGVGNYRGRGRYSQHGSRNYGDDFEPPLPDDVGPPVRMPRYFSRRDRSFSPSYDRNSRIPLPRRRSRSRSRTRSPRAWHPNREQRIFGNNNRRASRSPDFGPEARIERTRIPPPFSKSNFASDYGERSYISPHRGCRWVDDRSNSYANNHNTRRRRSPVRVFRRNERFDAFESGRLESDEYFRPPGAPSGRFPFMGKGGRECKLESNSDRRRGDGGEVMQRPPLCDEGGNIRRCRNDAVGDLGKSELKNNEDDDDVPRDDVKQSPTGVEGKRVVEV